jgi:hypothetical protein
MTGYRIACAVALVCVLSGCETDTTDPVDVTGTWEVQDASGGLGAFVLEQSGSSVSGRVESLGTVGTLTGTVSGNTVTLALTMDAYRADLTATVEGDSMSGPWSDNAGGGGTWNATRQSP